MNIILARLRTLLATISVKAGDVFEKDQVTQLNKLCKDGEVVKVCKEATFNMSVVKETVDSETYLKAPMHDEFARFINGEEEGSEDYNRLTKKYLEEIYKKVDSDKKHFKQVGDTYYYMMGEGAQNSGKEYKLIDDKLRTHQTSERKMSLGVFAVNVEDEKDTWWVSFNADVEVNWYAEVQRQTEGENEGKYVATGNVYPFIPLNGIKNVSYASNVDYHTSKQEDEKTQKGLLTAIDNVIDNYGNKFIEVVDKKKALNGNALRGVGKYLAKQFREEFIKFCEETSADVSDPSDRTFKQFASKMVPEHIKPYVEEFVNHFKQLRRKVEKMNNIEDDEEAKQINSALNMFLNIKDENATPKKQKGGYDDFIKWLTGWGRPNSTDFPISYDEFVKICNS